MPGAGGPPASPAGGGGRRRHLVLGGVLVLFVALIAGGIWFQVYRVTYQPLAAGGLGFGNVGAVRTLTDGVSETQDALVGRPGAVGAETYALADTGAHPVTILGLVPPFGGAPLPADIPVMSLRWTAVADNSEPAGGAHPLATSHPFPAHLGAHQQLIIWVVLRKPDCLHNDYEVGGFALRWRALGVTHTTAFTLGSAGSASGLPVAGCYQSVYGPLDIARR